MDIGSDESDGTAWATAPVIMRVSVTGSDANDGSSWAKARRTIASALALGRSADEVRVAEGLYAERLNLPPGVELYGGFSGSETLRGERDPGVHRTILDGGGSPTDTLVTCRFPNVVVDGFTLRNARNGVSVSGGTPTLTHFAFSGNIASAVTVTAGFRVTTDSVFDDNGAGALDHAVRVDAVELLTNFRNVYANNAVSLAVSHGSATVSHNRFAGISVGEGGIATIANNNVNYNRTGVDVSAGSATLVNNTIVYNQTEVFTFAGTMAMENNVLAFNSYYGVNRFPSGTITAFSHNDVALNNPENYREYTLPADRGNISVDSLLTDQWTSDYHLLVDSPCIDAGDDSAVSPDSTDMDGKPRIIGPHVDIGAFEYGASGTLPFTVADVLKALSIAGGLLSAGPADLSRLNVEGSGPATGADAMRIARKVAGLESNPQPHSPMPVTRSWVRALSPAPPEPRTRWTGAFRCTHPLWRPFVSDTMVQAGPFAVPGLPLG